MTEAGIAEVLGEDAREPLDSPFAGNVPVAETRYPEFSFTCQRFLLLQLAERAGNVVPSRVSYQTVLNNFYIEVRPGLLRLTGTDLELRVITSTPAVSLSYQDGQAPPPVVLPARRLLSILREAPDGDVTIRVKDSAATVSAGQASWELRLSKDLMAYPEPPDTDGLQWQETSRAALLGALKTVKYAVSRASTKASLGQVDIRVRERDGVACVTAGDSVRFAQVPLPGFPLEMRIPAAGSPSGADELTRLLAASEAEKIRVAVAGRKLFFGIDSTVFVAHQLTLEFPDISGQLLEPVLSNTDELRLSRADLREALRRVRINADDATCAIGLALSGSQLTVFARDKEHNQAEETIQVKWEGGERTLVLNHQFLGDMLAVHPSGECSFWLGRSVGKKPRPVLLKDEESGVTGILTQMAGALLGYG